MTSRISETDFNESQTTSVNSHGVNSVLPSLAAATAPLRSLQLAISSTVPNTLYVGNNAKDRDSSVSKNVNNANSGGVHRTLLTPQPHMHPQLLVTSPRNADGIEAVNITNTRSALNLTSSISTLFSAVNKSLSGALSNMLSLQPLDAAGGGTMAEGGGGQVFAQQQPQQPPSRRQSPTRAHDVGFSRAVDSIIDEAHALRNDSPHHCAGKYSNRVPIILFLIGVDAARILLGVKTTSYC